MSEIKLDKLPNASPSGDGGNSPKKTSVSKIIKIVSAIVMLLYIVSPVDLVPEIVVPVVGWVDDIIAGVGMAASLVSAFKSGRYDPKTRMEQRANDIFGKDNY